MSTTAERQPIDPRFAEMLEILHAGGTYSYWWNRDPNTNRKSTEWWAIDKRTNPTNGVVDAYYGIHPTAEIPPTNANGESAAPEHVRSQIKYIASVNALFGEFDAKRFGDNKQAALDHIRALPATPSSIVDSGGGYHVYWFLRSTWTMETEEDRKRACDMQYRWVRFIGSDDDAKDLARVLRVPGTHNLKYDHKPVVKFVKFDTSIMYDLDELVSLMPVVETPEPRPPTAARVDIADKRLAAYVEKVYRDEIADVVLTNDGKHKNLLEAAVAIGSILHYGISEDEAANALHDAVVGKAKDIKGADQTIRDGLKFGQANQRDLSEKLAPAQPAFNSAGVPLCVNCGTAMFRAKSKDVWGCKPCIDSGTPFWWEGNGYAATTVVVSEKPAQTATEATTETVKPVRKWLEEHEVEKLTPPEMLVKDTIPAGEVTVMFGPSDAGKTFVMVDITLRVAQHYPVMYVAAEDGPGIKIRKHAWQTFHKRSPNGNFKMWNDVVPLSEKDAVDEFITQVKWAGVKLVVIDTLSQCASDVDENSAKEMGAVLRNCNRIAHESGAAVAVIHHTTKNGSDFRGSGTIKANTYGFLKVENEDGTVVLETVRIKNLTNIKPRRYRLVSVDGTDSVVIQPAISVVQGDRLTGNQYKLLQRIGEISKAMGEAGSTELQRATELVGGNFYRPLNVLITKGFIAKGTSKNAGFYLTQDGKEYLTHEYHAENGKKEEYDPSAELFHINTALGRNVVDSGSTVDTSASYMIVEHTPRIPEGYDYDDVHEIASTTPSGSNSEEESGMNGGRSVVESGLCADDTPNNAGSNSGTSEVDRSTYLSTSPVGRVEGDGVVGTKEADKTQAYTFDIEYVRKCVDAGDVSGVQNHCRMYGRSFNEVMEQIMGDDDEDTTPHSHAP